MPLTLMLAMLVSVAIIRLVLCVASETIVNIVSIAAILISTAGVFYLFRLFRRTPEVEDHELEDGPTRAAGITPAIQMEATGGDNGR